MCGIAGVVSSGSGQRTDPSLVRRMCALIEHRGPDDEGLYDDGVAVLGMRRLSIIDVGGGQQPVRNEDGTIWTVFNGEIYNFRELRAELESIGHVFASHSDTETIVHAYEAYGDDFANHLHGMFSIAVWDARRERLLLARDRFGKKPLFYAHLPSGLVFGSELKCLLQHPEFERTIDPAALDEYLAFGYVAAPRSIFAMARKLRPAHLLIYEAGQVRTYAYWRLPPRRATGELTAVARREAADRLESLLEAAVRKRLISDVPLGAFLSGGLDSSVVVALMARFTGEPVKTFTIGFGDRRFNEAPAARRTARALGTEHHDVVVHPDFDSLLPTIVWGMDEPQGDSSAVPTYYVSQLARQYVTVCLTGDGGDEAFAGYGRYQQAVTEQAYDRLPPLLRTFVGELGARLPDGARGKRRLDRIASSWTKRYASAMTTFGRQERGALYQSDWRQQVPTLQGASHLDMLLAEHPHADLLSAVQWADIHSYLTDDILAKVDRMSMVNSLETRVPLLDHEVVEFAFSLPSTAFHAHGVSKLLFRDVARRLLPPEVLERPKSGFGIPLDDWLRGPLKPLIDEVILGDGLARRGWFKRAQLAGLVREHETRMFSHGSRLWTLLCLELWARQFVDTPPNALTHPGSVGTSASLALRSSRDEH